MNNRRLYSLKVKRVVFKQALGIRTCELSNTRKLSPRSSLRTCLLLYCIASASTVPARSYSNGPLELMILVSSIHTDICTEVIQNSPSPYLRVRVRTQATVSFPLTAISGWNPHVWGWSLLIPTLFLWCWLRSYITCWFFFSTSNSPLVPRVWSFPWS